MPDWDNTESRERDEDAAWRDLVARFDTPLTEQQPVPWPAREDMAAEPAPGVPTVPTGLMKRAGATGSIAGRRAGAWTQNPGGTRLTASTGGMPLTGSTDVTRLDRTAGCPGRTGNTRRTGGERASSLAG